MAVHPSLLQQFPLLAPLGAEDIESLSAHAQMVEFPKRGLVIDKGSPPQFLHFLFNGRLQAIDFTMDGREVGLYFIDEGDYFGEIAILDGQAHPEIVLATTKSQVVRVAAGAVRRLFFANPAIMEPLTQGLTRRIRGQIAQRQILGITNPLQRICAQLDSLAKPPVEGRRPMKVIIKVPTHQELAIMVNLTRETVTRTFQVLQSSGAIAREGNDLTLDASKIDELCNQSTTKD
jgi:CRP-like cAMP-binding protein